MFDFDVVSGPRTPTRLPKPDERPRANIPGAIRRAARRPRPVVKRRRRAKPRASLAGAGPPAG